MNDPVWLRILIQAIGPLISATVGTLIFGTFIATIARRAQDRLRDHELRKQLIADMTTNVNSLYLSTQRFWRERGKPDTTMAYPGLTIAEWLEPKDPKDPGEKERISKQVETLHEQYHKTRAEGHAIEAQLAALFVSDEPKSKFHAATDLLTVRYFQLVGECNERLLDKNAITPDNPHSGLTVDQLKIRKELFAKYHDTVEQFPRVVLNARRRTFKSR